MSKSVYTTLHLGVTDWQREDVQAVLRQRSHDTNYADGQTRLHYVSHGLEDLLQELAQLDVAFHGVEDATAQLGGYDVFAAGSGHYIRAPAHHEDDTPVARINQNGQPDTNDHDAARTYWQLRRQYSNHTTDE